MRGRWSSIVNRVVRSTNVPIAELPSPMIRSPSQCPGTARSSASAGRSLIMMSEPTNSLPRPRRRALGTRSAHPVRKHAVSSRRSAPRPRLPASPPPSSMFHSGPFTLAHDREARAVDEEMQAGTCGGATQRKIERLATPGECGVIGRGQVETQHPEDRRQEAFSLPQGQVDDEPERPRGFDGEIGILPLPATRATAHGLPGGDRIRGQPHGDITSLDQRSVVCRPIPDVVFCLVLWVHSRLHVEIRRLPSLRWPGCRAWLTEGAGRAPTRVPGKPGQGGQDAVM